jgi:hypothetical protein
LLTTPTPLSITTSSAPSTSQLSWAAVPTETSLGVTVNFLMARLEGPSTSFTKPQAAAINAAVTRVLRAERAIA